MKTGYFGYENPQKKKESL